MQENQLKETREHLVAAEVDLRRVQEKSGVIVIAKQAEAQIAGAVQVRVIAERQVQLKVLRGSATAQIPEVVRLGTEPREPSQALIVQGSTLAALLLSSAWGVVRRYGVWAREHFSERQSGQ